MKRKEVALVTGASSGIGLEIARLLAARNVDLVIAARRKDRLEALARDLVAAYGVRVDVVEADLARPGAAEELHRRTVALRPDVTIAVNNAGFGQHATVLEQSLADIRTMLQVDVTALTELSRLFAADMKRAGYGRILLLSSVGAFQPVPMYAVYSAAKAYVLSFGYALDRELRGTGVSVTTVCPGATVTEFHAVAGHEKTRLIELTSMSAVRVAAIAVRAMFRRRPKVVPGLLNKLMTFLVELAPRALSAPVAGLLMKRKRPSSP